MKASLFAYGGIFGLQRQAENRHTQTIKKNKRHISEFCENGSDTGRRRGINLYLTQGRKGLSP